MGLYNVTEMMVHSIFEDDYLKRQQLPCTCDQCKHDIMALALNRMPCRYVSTNRGEAYVRAQFFDPQMYSDIVRELTVAAQKVAQRPQHGQQE